MKNPFTIKLQAGILLAGELILLIASSIWDDLDPDTNWPAWFYIILFATGGYAIAGSKKWLVAYLCLSGSALLFSSFEGPWIFGGLSTLCFGCAFAMIFKEIGTHCFFRSEVSTMDRILAGVAGYLMLGFFWTSQSQWAGLLRDDAFLNLRTGLPVSSSEQLYFSFVTLTSLGYGDIVPTSAFARLLSMLNCLSGVLYLAIFISALVGSLAAGRNQDTAH